MMLRSSGRAPMCLMKSGRRRSITCGPPKMKLQSFCPRSYCLVVRRAPDVDRRFAKDEVTTGYFVEEGSLLQSGMYVWNVGRCRLSAVRQRLGRADIGSAKFGNGRKVDSPESPLLNSEWHIADIRTAPLRAHGLATRFKAKR